MYNSFYESLPPVDLGKSRVLSLLVAYIVYAITFLTLVASVIANQIELKKPDYLLIAIILVLCFSVGKVLIMGLTTLFSTYAKKTYKLTYNSLMMLKRGLIFQLFIFATIFLFKIYQFSVTPITTVIILVAFGVLAIEAGVLFTAYGKIIKPYTETIRNKFMEQQQKQYQGFQQAKQKSANWENPVQNSFINMDFVNQVKNQNQKMTKREEEKMVRDANVPIIDISEDLEDRVLSTSENMEKKDTKTNNKKEDNDNNKTISAF